MRRSGKQTELGKNELRQTRREKQQDRETKIGTDRQRKSEINFMPN